ncbi:MAG: 50S ribosomal protein L18 [Candidatus Paceibacterota bacterium]
MASNRIKEKRKKRQRRHKRVRAKIFGTAQKPRLAVFPSLNHIYAQLIDDENQKTLVSASDMEIKADKKMTKTEKAQLVGELLGKKANEKNIKEAVFDRGGFKYHGRVKSLCEGARKFLKI